MKGFRFVTTQTVRVADVDYGGCASNAAVLEYFQEARIAYLAALGSYRELDIGEGCGLIIPEARVSFSAEMFFGDSLQVGARVEEMRQRSFTMRYRIEKRGQGIAEGSTPIISFHYGDRTPRAVPAAFRAAVIQYEGLPATRP